MFFAMRAERFEPASTPEVRFMETAAGMPAAIKTWWYPGERSGYEFVYPKEQARWVAASAPGVRCMETAAGMPAAIKTWWYPGERSGYEFVYPKEQARRLAQGAAQAVLTTQSPSTTTEQT